ncbi:MAG: hypothetical protein ACI9C4_001449 [Paraglaciecola sp.]|jgi:hypothetical protein
MKITILILTLTLMITSTSQAQTLAEALQGCSDEVDNLMRLTCFDKLTKQTAKKSTSSSTSRATTTESPPPVSETREIEVQKKRGNTDSNTKKVAAFGLTNKPAQNSKLDKVVAIVTDVSKGPYGKLIISLNNQHVWKQSDGNSFRLKTGEKIYLEEGAMSSFFLSKESVNKRIRVKRIR